MALNSKPQLQNTIIYEIDVRNYSSEGNFEAVQRDLGRIKQLGADIIWLMPIYPIGLEKRKGSLGSPYAIMDHRKINPELGTFAVFLQLVNSIHEFGMKIMLDIVFNHTSLDSWQFQNHPEWFYKDEYGAISRKVTDWNDVIDLDYNQPELWAFQINTLKYWVAQGVDGFRCDVAPLVPLEFWQKARTAIQELKPDTIWLAESASPEFILQMGHQGFTIHSDGELYQAFDITYDYDVFDTFHDYLDGKVCLEDYLQLLCHQETIYPADFVKLRFLENHDKPRAASIIRSQEKLLLWTAFTYFQRGTTLLFAGQEAKDPNCPYLFEKDPVNWSGLAPDFTTFLQTLVAIKKDPLTHSGYYRIHQVSKPGVIMASYESDRQILLGIFNMEDSQGVLPLNYPDGEYINLMDLQSVVINDGVMKLQSQPVIIKAKLLTG